MTGPKPKAKNGTRCDCKALMREHLRTPSHRWEVSVFNFAYSHMLLEPHLSGLIPGHKKLVKLICCKFRTIRRLAFDLYKCLGNLQI